MYSSFENYHNQLFMNIQQPTYPCEQTNYINIYKQQFSLFLIRMPNHHCFKLYQCVSCKHFFVSKNGASQHYCGIQNILPNITISNQQDSHNSALFLLLRFIATCNISPTMRSSCFEFGNR